MEADGLSLDDKRQPVEANDIPDIIQKWHSRDIAKDTNRKAKAFFVPKEEIAENGYDLSINRYKEIEYEEVVYDHLSEEGLSRDEWIQDFNCRSGKFVVDELDSLGG